MNTPQTAEPTFRTGFVAIIGRPNVGKSTLMNKLIGQKVSITSKKAQTTRHRINGVLTENNTQYIFVDTPGFQTKHGGALNRVLNRNVSQALGEVDAVVWVIEAMKFTPQDEAVLKILPKNTPVILVINKVDELERKNDLLPFAQKVSGQFDFAQIIPVSAKNGVQTEVLLEQLKQYLPENPPFFDEDDITDRPTRFLATEIVREKIFRLSGDEVPYGCTVVIEVFEEEGSMYRIAAAVLVEREAHKGMIIGKDGERLKRIASESRQDMEKLFGCKIFLEVWVKVRSGWGDSEASLRGLGYE
ncbi:MAG: GTPase Era [Formosimonas sp.]|jgi:GTP-binding protein Era